MLSLCLAWAPPRTWAQAPATTAVLSVDASLMPGAGCITALELQRRVEQRSGPIDARSERRRIEVALQPRAAARGILARVRMLDAGGNLLGERVLRLRQQDCRSADEALVLIVSTLFGLPGAGLAVDAAWNDARDGAASEQPPAAPPPTEPVPSARQPPGPSLPPPERPAVAARSPRIPWQLRMVLGAGLLSGVASDPAAGVSLGLWAQRPHWSFGLEALALPRSRTSLGGGAETLYHAAWIDSQLCVAAARWGRGRFGLCAGARGGLLHAETRGLDTRATQLAPLWDLTLGPRVTLGRAASKTRGFVSARVTLPIVVNTFQIVEIDGTIRTFHEQRPGVWLVVGFSWGRRS